MNGWIEKTGQRTEKWELVTGNWELGKGNPIYVYVRCYGIGLIERLFCTDNAKNVWMDGPTTNFQLATCNLQLPTGNWQPPTNKQTTKVK